MELTQDKFNLKTNLDNYMVSTVVTLSPFGSTVMNVYETMVFASESGKVTSYADIDSNRVPMEGDSHRALAIEMHEHMCNKWRMK